ncbi:MAG TPA: hypothetical protein VLJ15_06125 [Gammaproteobacteria bacterium]|nr:hypothetical protein [Gammaproteobacteria bacterium]
MWCTQLRLPVLLLTFLGLTACVTNPPTATRVVEVQPVAVTPLTACRGVTYVPACGVSCAMVPGHWIYSTWIPAHRECIYAYTPGKVTYVNSYCGCGYGCGYAMYCGHCGYKHHGRHVCHHH